MRSGRCLGMILYAENRLAAHAQPFQRAVVQAEVGHLNLIRVETAWRRCSNVILRGDRYFAAAFVTDRVVAAVMPELRRSFSPPRAMPINWWPRPNPNRGR